MLSPHSLSREEQAELARSTKKVKDVYHAGFCEEQTSSPPSLNQDVGPWNVNMSFKDKLVGEILGAYTQGFNFGDFMEDDAESDEEVEVLWQGVAAVDVEKPLITTVLIGRLEQPVAYEGIHKLCFGCGRMGHHKETCPYTTRWDTPNAEVKKDGTTKTDTNPCNSYVQDSPRADAGPREDVQVNIHAPRGKRVNWQESKENMLSSRIGSPNGPSREAKRKLSPLRILEKAQVSKVIQSLRVEPVRQAQLPSIHTSNTDSSSHEGWAEEELRPLRLSLKVSVKGKKILARNRASQVNTMCAAGIPQSNCPNFSVSPLIESSQP
nr:hypothetical protein CFP56_01780 [Quercus suber]